MLNRLRVGILGLGAFGESHIRGYQSLPFVEVAAVASRSPDRAAAVARQFGIPTWYGSHAELISDESIQAVSITTAEFEHREPTVEALAAGKHVLVEKPLASTLDDARAILAAARSSSGILMPGHILRFDPKYATLRERAASGDLGRIVALTARRNRPRSLIKGYSRVHPALVTTIHDIDIMLWIAGQDVHKVYAVDRLADRDDGAHGLWGLLEFEGGTVGTIETSWLIPDLAGLTTDDAFQAIGLEGSAKVQLDTPVLRIWHSEGTDVPDLSYEPSLHGGITGALRDELAHFAGCAFLGTSSSIVSPEDGVQALAIVLALIESAKQGRAIAPQVRRTDITAAAQGGD